MSRLSGTCRQVAQAATATRGTLMKKAARHEIVSTRKPPTTGPRIVVAPDAPAHVPNARPCSSPEKFAVRRASEPGTSSAPAAPRIQRLVVMSLASKIAPAHEVFQNTGSRRLVERDAMAGRGDEGRARPHRDLETALAFQASLLQGRGRLAEILDTVDVDRAIALEVVREQDMGRPVSELDHRDAGTHALHGEGQPAAHDLGEVARVGGHIATGRVEEVE